MKNAIVLIGKPNVGKSTLFNLLTKSQNALVSNTPNLTKDRRYGKLNFKNKIFYVIDTGSINKKKNEIEKKIYHQTKIAIEESKIIFFIIDIREGIIQSDKNIIKKLHKYKKKIYLILNKIDNFEIKYIIHEYYTLGIKEIYPISALYGIGIKKLIYQIFLNNKNLKNKKENTNIKKIEKKIKLTIIGKPNVGKSTLINKIIKKERIIVSDIPGTTTDDIHISFKKNKFCYTLIDTHGIVQNQKNKNLIEKKLKKRTFNLIKKTDIILFIFDIKKEISKKDIKFLDKIVKKNKPIIIIFNKIDKIKDKNNLKKIKNNIKIKLKFFYFIEINFISASKNINIKNLFYSIEKTYQSLTNKIKTSSLIKIAKKAEKKLKSSLPFKRNIKIKYACVLNYKPIIFLIHGSNINNIQHHSKIFLIKFFYKNLKIKGIKINLILKNIKKKYKINKKKIYYAKYKKNTKK